MTQCCLPAKRFIFLSVVVFFGAHSRFLRLSAQAPSATQMFICEAIDDTCNRADAHHDIVWTFDGTDGRVSTPATQAGTLLTVEKFDSESIVVRRVDRDSPTAGLTAVYTGRITGSRVNGSVDWSWPNHPGYPTRGTFSGRIGNGSSAGMEELRHSNAGAGPASATVPPSELLVCENSGPCNAAWTFQGNTGTGTWYTRNPTRATLTLVRFEQDYIVIRRTDTTDGISATYAGSPRGDHYSGTIVWSGAGNAGTASGTWTATIPQTDCSIQTGLEADNAMLTGEYALMFKRKADALGCYLVAAKLGDATAQAAVGLLYYQGRDVAQDYKEAFSWLHKAADQGVYAAQRTIAEMYITGQGTSQNSKLAAIYTARADEQKHDMERREDFEERAQARREEHAERAADRMNQLLSNFVLGASFGIFF